MNTIIQNITSNILSVDILDNRIIAGHLNGSISCFDKRNFELIKTFTAHSTGSPVNFVKTIVNETSIQYLLLITTSTAYATTVQIKYSIMTDYFITKFTSNVNDGSSVSSIVSLATDLSSTNSTPIKISSSSSKIAP